VASIHISTKRVWILYRYGWRSSAFMPEDLKRLEKHRKVRLGLALLIFCIGLGAVVSDSQQKQEDKLTAQSERDAARLERNRLSDQVTQLIRAQSESTQAETAAGTEMQTTRTALGAAYKDVNAHIDKTKPLPPAYAALQFSFWVDDLLADFPVKVKSIMPTLLDGTFSIDLTVRNVSDTPAKQAEVWIQLCDKCDFAGEPTGFDKPAGSNEHQRHRVIPILNSGVFLERMTLVIRVEPNVEFGAFPLLCRYSCETCKPNAATSLEQELTVLRDVRQ
jgi:hypothetical protein